MAYCGLMAFGFGVEARISSVVTDHAVVRTIGKVSFCLGLGFSGLTVQGSGLWESGASTCESSGPMSNLLKDTSQLGVMAYGFK